MIDLLNKRVDIIIDNILKEHVNDVALKGKPCGSRSRPFWKEISGTGLRAEAWHIACRITGAGCFSDFVVQEGKRYLAVWQNR